MAAPGGAPKNSPPTGAAGEDMAVQQQKEPTVRINVFEYTDDSNPQEPVKVYDLSVTTRDGEGKQVPAKVKVRKNDGSTTTEARTSDSEDTRGQLDIETFRLKPGNKDVIVRVDNLTYGGSDQVTLTAPPKPETHYHPKKGTVAFGIWLGTRKGH